MRDIIEQYKILHSQKRGYGTTGKSLVPIIEPLVRMVKPKSIIDYGAGKSTLVDLVAPELEILREKYDPAVEGIDALPPGPFDMLFSTDVLEHFPEELVDEALAEMRSLAPYAIHAISLRPSGNNLPDGRPCHLCVKDIQWWREKLGEHYRRVRGVHHFASAKKIVFEALT